MENIQVSIFLEIWWDQTSHLEKGLVGSMPLQLLEVGFHVEIHAIEWHDFQREIQIHGVVVA